MIDIQTTDDGLTDNIGILATVAGIGAAICLGLLAVYIATVLPTKVGEWTASFYFIHIMRAKMAISLLCYFWSTLFALISLWYNSLKAYYIAFILTFIPSAYIAFMGSIYGGLIWLVARAL